MTTGSYVPVSVHANADLSLHCAVAFAYTFIAHMYPFAH